VALPPERRAALLAAKLAALVASQSRPGEPAGSGGASRSGRPGPFPGGATLVVGPDTTSGDRAADDGVRASRGGPAQGWVLADEQPERALGPAMAWGASRSIVGPALHVVTDRHADLLARRAAAFRQPPTVWQIEGAELVAATPAAPPVPAPPPDAALDLVARLEGQGIDVVIDHGEIIGEVLGLEVARVVVDPDGSAHLEVGVGRNDREAFALIHADQAPEEALASVVATVSAQRRAEAPPHPLNRLGAQRWLRARLVAEPGLVGAAHLVPVAGVLPRGGVKESVPVAAVGTDPDGGPVVVVTSTGIDLDLVPAAADLRLAHSPAARLVLAVPERDAHAVTRRLAAALVDPAELVALPGDWR
jgi:hypothetical protein